MNNITVIIKCGFCEKEVILQDEQAIDVTKFAFLKIDFKEGVLTYICDECEQQNVMHLNSNAQINRGRRLPHSKGFQVAKRKGFYTSITYCIYCGSDNIEYINKHKYLCSSCESVFGIKDFQLDYKIANKKMMLETGEMNLKDIVDGSIDYIFKRGVILAPAMEQDLRKGVGHIPDEVILARLSDLEISTEDIMEQKNEDFYSS